MHVLQWLAVQAEDEDEAMSSVEYFLNEQLGGDDCATDSWFDWFVIGGGRWNPEQDPYESSSNMILSVNKHGVLGMTDKVDECMSNRITVFNEYRQTFEKDEVDLSAELDKYNGNTDYSFSLYPLKKMIDMIQGNWDFNSYFFDVTNDTTNPRWFLDKIKVDSDWCLVPIDFHF